MSRPVSTGAVQELPPEVLTLTRQLDQQRLDELASRYDELRRENEALRERIQKGEKDSRDFVTCVVRTRCRPLPQAHPPPSLRRYFQGEIEAKDMSISKLTEELTRQEAELRRTAASERTVFDAK